MQVGGPELFLVDLARVIWDICVGDHVWAVRCVPDGAEDDDYVGAGGEYKLRVVAFESGRCVGMVVIHHYSCAVSALEE